MDKISFRMFKWPQNPEVFEIYASREPQYQTGTDGLIQYTGLGPLCRTIKARGVFQGPSAHSRFNALSVIMATGSVGDLVHPIWGTISAYITQLNMEQDSRENYVAYSIVFREANESGEIPHLPDGIEPH